MAFREKSAWAMGLLFLLITIWFVGETNPLGWREGVSPPPYGPLSKVMLWSIIGAIIVQSILAARFSREAGAPADERERQFIVKASHHAGVVLGVGVVSALFHYLVMRSGDTLFHMIVFSLLVSTVAEYALQIFYFRRGH